MLLVPFHAYHFVCVATVPPPPPPRGEGSLSLSNHPLDGGVSCAGVEGDGKGERGQVV